MSDSLIRDEIIDLVKEYPGSSQSYIFMILDKYYPLQILQEKLSEAAQDNLIKRVEYQLPNSPVWLAIYFPFGTKIA